MKGKLIVFEGPEGCGKSTQAQMAFEYLKGRGIKTVLLREPGGNVISEKIRAIILDPAHKAMTKKTELLLYIASRAQIIEEKLKPLLDGGATVILDRFSLSTLVYQGYARGLDKKQIKILNDYVAKGVKVFMTVVFDVTEKEAAIRLSKREKHDRLDAEAAAFHKKVRAGYLAEAANNKSIYLIKTDGKSKEEIFNETIKLLCKKRVC
ncbi:MAG TPA: dTMP kinase [Candidatus Goldiibacteriota bacterium]|nr:dTMP kinase [Candidatus Goldiibacteriota bacterium]HRQ43503.1 dTMP kinase [Candidatus Goldiibacteriota bacterium]